MSEPCFKLKGGMVPMTVLELNYFDAAAFSAAIADKVRQAPMFFQQTPVVISLDKCQGTHTVDMTYIDRVCRENGMRPVALRGPESLSELATGVGMAFIPSHGKRGEGAMESLVEESAQQQLDVEKQPVAQAAAQTQAEPEIASPVSEHRTTKVITQPVRSGQQVYAPGADLIVLAQVSEGAEVLADGHIHVYGPLRGRALAGVKGDESARIFCQSMEAELLSVAGHFKVHEDLRSDHWKKPAQIYYQADTLHVTPL
jgi:septum site-determining protein MinC